MHSERHSKSIAKGKQDDKGIKQKGMTHLYMVLHSLFVWCVKFQYNSPFYRLFKIAITSSISYLLSELTSARLICAESKLYAPLRYFK